MITNQPPDAIIQPPGHKLFFALWPDENTRAALARLQPLAPGRALAPAKLHLTLAFLGQQPATALAPLRAILAGLDGPALPLLIDSLGYFHQPRIGWAGMAAAPATLLTLQAGLIRQLAAAGLCTSAHGPFKPHVTLARDASPPQGSFAPVPWHADTVALVESLPNGNYVLIATKNLQ